MQDAYEVHSTQPELTAHFVSFVGGTTAVTKVAGPGVTVSYIGTGIVDLVWAENPGTFLGCTHGFQATTVAALKGYSVVVGAFNTTTFTLRLNITSASDALVDLAALQWLALDLKFKRTAV